MIRCCSQEAFQYYLAKAIAKNGGNIVTADPLINLKLLLSFDLASPENLLNLRNFSFYEVIVKNIAHQFPLFLP